MKGLAHWLGVEPNPVSLREKLISTLGALIGIGITALISSRFLGTQGMLLMIGSMGASAVLLFAVPHGQLSQPWPAVIGQLVSASVGVVCASLLPNEIMAAALAVSLAILAMHLTRSLHPPGGATALIAVIGGPDIHELGWAYILAPVALNAVSILLVALLFNNFFGWRRYPAAMARSAQKPVASQLGITIADLEHAIRKMDSTIDVTEEELMQIYVEAMGHKDKVADG